MQPTASDRIRALITAVVASAAVVLGGACASAPGSSPRTAVAGTADGTELSDSLERDRQAILAMAGDYEVTFYFDETVSFVEGYEPKEPTTTHAQEVVFVIEDRPGFISLQHILLVGGERKVPLKHWRQDWVYEPEEVLVFIGGNAWQTRPVPPERREGRWAQMVYQVDDSPRYGAVGAWSHDDGISEWKPAAEWRPLPRRDMTKRDDYHAVEAVNRHALTPDGWVHEQDNSKLVLTGEPQVLVREVGVNTYRRSDDVESGVARDYWRDTRAYWAEVRGIWNAIQSEHDTFGLTVPGEPDELYSPLLGLAKQLRSGDKELEPAVAEAREVIERYTTSDVGALEERLARR